ncbi:inhibitor of cysteine peptidase [Azotobacter beijerinckii]|uniref:Inhibitor of cysteine peptidase n=1 Tax=Azotobacter beijerinckii TaxID=170623 RepID=A0A1H6QV58_9GAMM|nr:protease inhibitor I42 family protein [Azotobacter beijerinckii]SEI43155.1 inhibitor of cysteine peptidase [Azotobacter beijerinckii]SEI72513.1 inhibitor of cysteine peptidase [Azotobacter beijerinckii]
MRLALPCLLTIGLVWLAGCAHSDPSSVVALEDEDDCPLQLESRQQLVLTLPSNPSTGYRWQVRESASKVLRSLGPEVYSSPKDSEVVGSAGQSTWRFQAVQAGQDTLLLVYRRPWEVGVEPAKAFDCAITVE